MMRFNVAAMLLVGSVLSAGAAEIDFGVSPTNPNQITGIRIEGEIVVGDADKFREFFRVTGPTSLPVRLASKGGDVAEAMKIGRLLRTLRMTTSVPTSIPGAPPICGSQLSDATNCICASACVLIFAGGVLRDGNLLVLHRPYLAAAAAARMTSDQHEAVQKNAMNMVKHYLEEMEIPSYYTNLMMSRSSVEAYVVSLTEAFDDSHRLMGYAPSIEEITLSKCQLPSTHERETARAIARKGALASRQESASKKQVVDKTLAGVQCQVDVVTKMRAEAFAREFPGEHPSWSKPK